MLRLIHSNYKQLNSYHKTWKGWPSVAIDKLSDKIILNLNVDFVIFLQMNNNSMTCWYIDIIVSCMVPCNDISIHSQISEEVLVSSSSSCPRERIKSFCWSCEYSCWRIIAITIICNDLIIYDNGSFWSVCKMRLHSHQKSNLMLIYKSKIARWVNWKTQRFFINYRFNYAPMNIKSHIY